MALWIDTKYANLLSVSLDRFRIKQTNPFLANLRCPICGDSQKSRNRARGYLYTKNNSLFYKCHNCGAGLSFANFLKQVDTNLHNQYRFERYKESDSRESANNLSFAFEAPQFEEKSMLDRLLDRIDRLPSDNDAVQYCRDRMIPHEKWSELYYIDDVAKIEQLSSKYRDKIEDIEPRIVIPFYNRQGKLVGVSCRALDDHPIKYLTIRIDEMSEMFYNLENIDMTKAIYVVEGPFDSMFLPNAIAVGTSDLKKVGPFLPKEKTVLVFDNQPRNREIVKIMRKAVEQNFTIVVWPETMSQKDINDMILAGYTSNEILNVINKSTCKDLVARLRLNAWSKV